MPLHLPDDRPLIIELIDSPEELQRELVVPNYAFIVVDVHDLTVLDSEHLQDSVDGLLDLILVLPLVNLVPEFLVNPLGFFAQILPELIFFVPVFEFGKQPLGHIVIDHRLIFILQQEIVVSRLEYVFNVVLLLEMVVDLGLLLEFFLLAVSDIILFLQDIFHVLLIEWVFLLLVDVLFGVF